MPSGDESRALPHLMEWVNLVQETSDLREAREVLESLPPCGDDPENTVRDPRTFEKALAGKPVRWKTQKLIRDKLSRGLGVAISVPELRQSPPPTLEATGDGVAWRITRREALIQTLDNGLQVEVCRCVHTALRWEGRGKIYHFGYLQTSGEEIGHLLTRHTTVADAARGWSGHPNLAKPRTAFPLSDVTWMVVDEWVDGCTLADVIDGTPLPKKVCLDIALGLAAGLGALHDHGVVVRVLAPSRVILRDASADGRWRHPHGEAACPTPILTDFELSKVTALNTVKNEAWDMDGFRAPEINEWGGEGPPDQMHKVDMYSWAAVLVAMLTGHEPTNHRALRKCIASELPELSSQARELLLECVAAGAGARPKSMQIVAKRLKRAWK